MSQKEYKMSLMSISESNKLKEFIVFTLLIISGFVYKLKIQGKMSQWIREKVRNLRKNDFKEFIVVNLLIISGSVYKLKLRA